MPKAPESATLRRETRPSLVDVAEEALRSWLATGRHRPGERLPPEQELSAHLGISRGTLRTALRRLEESGEIVRRQGSGTYVGRAASSSLDEGLEKLVSYSDRDRGHARALDGRRPGGMDARRGPPGHRAAVAIATAPGARARPDGAGRAAEERRAGGIHARAHHRAGADEERPRGEGAGGEGHGGGARDRP